jgi:hypothetical protein
MDVPLVLAKKLYSAKKYSTFFIFRLWIGYGFDAAEFTAVMIRYGFDYVSVEWMYVLYVYLGLLALVAFIITIVFRLKDAIPDRKVHSALAYFKLTATVNAALIFFQLYLQGQRDEIAIFLMVVTGIDMGLDFMEMAAGCAALGVNVVYPLDNKNKN